MNLYFYLHHYTRIMAHYYFVDTLIRIKINNHQAIHSFNSYISLKNISIFHRNYFSIKVKNTYKIEKQI